MWTSWLTLRRVGGSLRVAVFVSLLLASSTHAFLQLLTLLLPIAVLQPQWFSWIVSQLAGFWHWYTITLCEHLLRVKIVTTGTPADNRRPILMLMNHRTRLDWLFFFCCQGRYASLSSLRICLKESLKHIPGAGWVIQCLVFLFIKRRWEADENVFDNCIQYYFQVGLRPHILLFPEGTDLNRGSREASDKFAMKNNFAQYNQVLHPHTKGFIFMLEKLTQYCNLTEIMDITVSYPYNACQNEMDLLVGNIPREVHFHVQTIPARSLPTNHEQLDAWCRELWKKKEERLANFHHHKLFPLDTQIHLRSDRIVFFSKLVATWFWLSHTILSTFLLFYKTFIPTYYLLSLSLYVVCTIGFSGFDTLIPYLHKLHKQAVSVKQSTA